MRMHLRPNGNSLTKCLKCDLPLYDLSHDPFTSDEKEWADHKYNCSTVDDGSKLADRLRYETYRYSEVRRTSRRDAILRNVILISSLCAKDGSQTEVLFPLYRREVDLWRKVVPGTGAHDAVQLLESVYGFNTTVHSRGPDNEPVLEVSWR